MATITTALMFTKSCGYNSYLWFPHHFYKYFESFIMHKVTEVCLMKPDYVVVCEYTFTCRNFVYIYIPISVCVVFINVCVCVQRRLQEVCIFFHCYTYKIFYIQFLVKRLWWVLSYCEMFLHDIHGCTMFAVLLKTRLGKLFVADFLL